MYIYIYTYTHTCIHIVGRGLRVDGGRELGHLGLAGLDLEGELLGAIILYHMIPLLYAGSII